MNPYVQGILDYEARHHEDLQLLVSTCEPEQAAASNKYIEKLVATDPVAPLWREPDDVFPQNDQVFTCSEFYRNAVNFCYADPKTGEKFRVGKFSGSMAMGHCFFRKFGQEFVHADEILDLTEIPGALENFFAGDTPMPLLEERRRCLREAALVLRSRFFGRPANILLEAGFKVVRDKESGKPGVVELLMENFPLSYGQDKVEADGQTLVFAKRPYLWPLMYQGRAMEEGSLLPKLDDPYRIGPVVDYQIPNALRHLGIIKYSDDLGKKIDAKQPIKKGSEEELAIRVATTAVLYGLMLAANAFKEPGRRKWTMVELDYELWSMGRGAAKAGLQHHLTETTDY